MPEELNEPQLLERTSPVNTEFQKSVKTFTVTEIPSETAQKAFSDLDKILTDENRIALDLDSRNNLDMNNAKFVKTNWGGILIIKPISPNGRELAILYDGTNNEIAGYGTMQIKKNQKATVDGRIFKKNNQQFKQSGIKPSKVMQDRFWAQLALQDQPIDRLELPQSQLFNPQVSGYETPSVPAYWRMGFRNGSKLEEQTIPAFESGQRINNETLIAIAKKGPMRLDLKPYAIPETKAEIELKPATKDENNQTMQMLNNTHTGLLRQSHQTTDRSTIDRLTKKIKSL